MNCNSFRVLLCSVYVIRCCVCVARLEDQVCLKIAADSGLIEGSRVLIPLEYYCVLLTNSLLCWCCIILVLRASKALCV